MTIYVEAPFIFEDYKIILDGLEYYVAGETTLYSEDEGDFEFAPATITLVQDAEFEEVDLATLPYVALHAAVHMKIDSDPYVWEKLEMERLSWLA